MLEFSLAHPWIAAFCCTLVAICVIVEVADIARRAIDAWRPAELAKHRVMQAEGDARMAVSRAALTEFELERHKQVCRTLQTPQQRVELS